MHLVVGSESHKTISGLVTQALGRIEGLFVRVRETTCSVVFMVVDTDNYDVILRLDFLIKIGAIVDVERSLIQVKQGPGSNVQVLPLNMVNMLQLVTAQPNHSNKFVNQMVPEFFQLSLLDKKEQTKSTHDVDDWEEALDQISEDENEMYDSIAGNNRFQRIV